MNYVQRAVAAFPSQAAFARQIGRHPQEVTRWIRTGKVPAKHCQAVEQAVEQALASRDRSLPTLEPVTRYELRPDVFGHQPGAPDPEGA
ncbi:YdaS family helix-turn-helix protein [Dyella marensis]|uniref:transcriptional regulator n=1 Tax=Dyella TaxID=231454 RepID=UPI0009DDF425|nr:MULTISPECIES: YdaS family helix-turn-helix protein [Dyella]